MALKLIFLVCAVGFTYATGIAFLSIYKRAHTSEWLSMEAKVKVFELPPPSNTGTPVYRPKIEAHYKIDGVNYVCRKFDFTSVKKYNATELHRILGSSEPTSVVVYYDPMNPSNSVITRGGAITDWILAVMGSAVSFICWWVFKRSF